jgi:hypothetical protein
VKTGGECEYRISFLMVTTVFNRKKVVKEIVRDLICSLVSVL